LTTGKEISWSVSDPSIAFVESLLADEAIALIYGVAEGDVNVSYRDFDARGQSTGNEGSSPLTVTAAILQDIELWPFDDQSRPEGTSLQFTATGVYGPSDNRDITDDVNWISSDPAVAVFDIETKGLLYTLPGTAGNTADVTASMENTDNPPELIESLPVNVTVSNATLDSINLAPITPKITVGETIQFTVTGYFSDGVQSDITERVTWSSDEEFFATVSNNPGSKGLATGVSVGTATIRVQDPQSALQANTNLTVSQE